MVMRSGRYETLRVIASGGMATVHLARVHGAGGFERLVALKVMHPHIAADPDFVNMFLDEARLAARIHHPNVVGTSDVQEDEDGLFLVMDYIEGAPLQAVLREPWRRGETVRLDVALRIFLDALAGLHAAHELIGADGAPLHVVHRDVSPQNILVGVDGIARLTDFGVARARSRLSTTHAGRLKGKLTYMAPEQVRCEPVDRRADVYSAGVVLWEVLAGERLMRSDSDGGLVQSILEGVSRSPADARPSVPAALSEVCMRALRLSPSERYATAAAMAEAVEAAAEAEGASIATARAVAQYLSELDICVDSRRARAVSPSAATLPAMTPPATIRLGGLGDEVTARERATTPDRAKAALVVSAPRASAPLVSAPLVSAPVVSAPLVSAPTGDQEAEVIRVERAPLPAPGLERPRGRAVTAVAVLATALVIGVAGLSAALMSSWRGRPSATPDALNESWSMGGIPLDPPSAVEVPMDPLEAPTTAPREDAGSSATSAALGGGPAEGARESSARARSSGAQRPRGPGALPTRGAAPSPTAFRPRDL